MKRILLVLAACGSSSKPPPVANTTPPAPPPKQVVDCNALLDKIMPVLAPEMHPSPTERAQAVDACKQEQAKDPDNPVYGCLMAANDKSGMEACIKDADQREAKKTERGHGPRKTEAELQLNKLGKNAKVYFITNAEFAKGTTKQLPEKSCCGQPSNRCVVTDAWTRDPVWQALDFEIDEPNLFQYSYTSDGKTFHAEAVGDLDCDGIFITYKLDGEAVQGNPRFTLTPPPPNAD